MLLDGRPVLVYVSLTYWDGIWRGAQQLMSRIARDQGWRVMYVEPAVSVASPLRDRGRFGQLRRRHRSVGENMVVVTPLAIPPQTARSLRACNMRLVAHQVRSALDAFSWTNPEALIINHPYGWRLCGHFPDAAVVAHLTDEPIWRTPDYLGEYYKMLSTADAAMAVSPPLVTRAESLGTRVILVQQGVDVEALERSAAEGEPDDIAWLARPRVGYVGTLSNRVDAAVVHNMATAHPEWQFVFIGAASTTDLVEMADWGALAQAAGLPNVHLLGSRPQELLGAYLAACDAGWVPYVCDDFNRNCNPLKVMEYLACGLPVVAADLAALRPLSELVSLVPEGGDYAEPLTRAVLGESGTAGGDAQLRRAFARDNSWDRRAAEVARFLASVCHRTGETPVL